MDERDYELFNDSLERCQSRPKFLDRFYELFIASDGSVAEKFANTDLHKQKMMLKVSLYMLLSISDRHPSPESILHLERIAERHSRAQLDIKPETYGLWLNCMLQAVKEFDPKYDSGVDSAWRHALAKGIEFMQAKY
jgi:hemoglobin-like flavoprotein